MRSTQVRGAGELIPQTLHVPTVALAIVVQVPDGAAASLDAPVFAVTAVGPPAALDAPSADHVGDLVPATAPHERGRHPGIPLDPHLDLLVVAFRHRLALFRGPPPSGIERMFEGKLTIRPGSDTGQVEAFPLLTAPRPSRYAA